MELVKNHDAISVIGLGKVGSAILATYAAQNVLVYGYDTDESVVDSLKLSRAKVSEKYVDELLLEHRNNIVLTGSIFEAINKSDFTFVILPTPSDINHKFSNSFLIEACKEIASALISKKGFHTICVSSTVMPGTLRTTILPLIEKISGKKEGIDFGVAYSPEFIALGNIVNNLINPDLILIGNTNNRTYEEVAKVKSKILKTRNLINLTFDEAEIVKLSINSFITMKISFANMIGEIADKNRYSNKFRVLDAIGSDSRIGSKFIRPGLGYGGPCFPRDNKAMSSYSIDVGVESLLPIATDLINDRQVQIIVDTVIQTMEYKSGSILFLGVTYKEETGSIEESQVVKIGETLIDLGHQVYFHDFNLDNYSYSKMIGFQRIQNFDEVDFNKFDLIVFSQKEEGYRVVHDLINKEKSRIMDLWGLFNVNS